MKEYRLALSRDGRITLPAELRRYLGLKPGDHVTLVITDDGKVTLRPPRSTLASVRGSHPELPNQSEDFEREIEEVMEERAEELVRRLHESG